MKAFFGLFILAGMLVKPAHAQFDPAVFVPETLPYRLLSGAVIVGNASVTISRENAAGTLHLVESISGLFEQTAVVTMRDDTSLQPLTTQVVIARNNQYHELKLEYRFDGQHVTGEMKRPLELGGVRSVDLALPAGTTDLYLVPHLFRASALAVGKTLQFPLFNGLQNEKSFVRAWVSRLESVTVPAGVFECFRLESFVGNSRVMINIDTQFPHRVVRQIFPELQVKFELIEK
ncbi:MAG: hypothetical protein ALAOOOJD_01169 [bacterium]|nr:hypothetical protein [bacterium]